MQAYRHGFSPITLINTYSDYPGGQKENIAKYIGHGSNNPWNKPPFFERIIKRNIDRKKSTGTVVNDIEIGFEQEAVKAWADPKVRTASGAKNLKEFQEAYFREWASWFSLPLKWTKENYPETKVGLYGVQPFRRDYWGIAGKKAQQIDGTHQTDWRLWKYIDEFADFYVASIYIFYNKPDSIFYMAANVEENYLRTRRLGNKPVYAYEWLRYHNSNWRVIPRNRELDPYFVEAMAILPFFSGAKGIVLWGHEPHMKAGGGQPYEQLPLFMKALRRVALLSGKIGRARLVIDEPAHVLWKEKRPLVRRLIVKEGECIVMAINPWQSEHRKTHSKVRCGNKDYPVTMRGSHTMIAYIDKHGLREF